MQSCKVIDDYVDYLSAILGRSELTIKEYRYDLQQFFKFIIVRKQIAKLDEATKNWDKYVNLELLENTELSDLYAFIAYLKREKNASVANRSRKIACLRSFFKYLFAKVKVISKNPADELETPKQVRRNPKYLEMDEAINLLATILKSTHQRSSRDYCIIVLFLNCGLRLSELWDLKVSDWRDNHLKVIGKGNKERLVYLNKACIDALHKYITDRESFRNKDLPYLFISRQGNRLSKPAIQLLVKKYLKLSGLDEKSLSTHKLRHTAATLMYKYGQVDIRTLQHILGHSSVSTTEIYTHLDSQTLENAVAANPLANV